MSYITAIGVAVPEHRFSQSTICDFMEVMMGPDEDVRRKIRAVFRASGIRYRHSVLEDYGRTSGFSFYPNCPHDRFPDTSTRMQVFREAALPLSIASVRNLAQSVEGFQSSSITHLILVSCTGMYAPGLDIELVKALELPGTVQRTCIQFMGCYAAFNALKAANAFCHSDPDSKVIIVCTELCSLHFQQSPSEDNILANALFGDGSAALLVESRSHHPKKLKMLSFHNDLAFSGEEHMAWKISNTGFEMNLSSYVPDLIKDQISPFVQKLLGTLQKRSHEIKYFAFHPGGRKILETLEAQLGITKEKNEASHNVLQDFGNLSSVTIVFVLHLLFQKFSRADHNELILALGFGPGLTLESMLLQIELL